MKKKLSIHDIARELKVSATTVSLILNGKSEEKRISSSMKTKVLEYVSRVGFQPNQIAQSLRTGKSKIIGMMVEDISDPFFSAIARIIEEQAYKVGYKIFNSSTENDTHKAKALIKVFRDRQVDGYIIAPTSGLETEISSLVNDNFPVILFDRYFPGVTTSNVVVDNTAGAYNAAKHLHENNCTAIGLVTLESEQVQMLERLDGYMNLVREKGLDPHILKIAYNMDHQQRTRIIHGFCRNNPALDGILFATNYLAIAGIEAIRTMGLTIPEDISIVGFDDNSHFSLFSPSISAVAQPIALMSAKIIELLIARLSGKESMKITETTVLPTSLIIRQSSRRLKENKISIQLPYNG